VLITLYRAHPSVLAAVQTAAAACERQEEIAMFVRSRRELPQFLHDIDAAAVGVLDLRTITINDAVQLSTQVLEARPFVKLTTIAGLQATLDEQRQYFTLGRVGVAQVPLAEEASSAAFWQRYLLSQPQFSVLDMAFRYIQSLMMPGPRADWLLRLAKHVSAPSIKILAERIYPSNAHSNAYKRRRLWQECKNHHVGTPEDVHAAIRLVLLKQLLDSEQWTLTRIARYFGYDTARHLSRSCKTRYKLSLREIKALTHGAIMHRAGALFTEHAPWEVVSIDTSTPS